MSPDMVVALSRQAIEVALFMALPMLGVSLIVGVVISILQAATQIQETTLTFVPKILAMFLALLVAFPWMMDKLVTFTRDLLMNIPVYLK